MSQQRSRTKIVEFKAQTQAKIANLLTEYASGKISREQFDALYAHHHSQLDLAEAALETKDSELVETAGGRTIGIRQSSMGKAVGLLIYHRRSNHFFESLGNFDVPHEEFTESFRAATTNAPGKTDVLYHRKQIASGYWLLFTSGKHTMVVTLFRHEPSPAQISEIQRLHSDFEVANTLLLAVDVVETEKLAYPFRVFVQRKLQQK